MTEVERLCLPICGFHLTDLNPCERPGYDDFEPMIDEEVLEKLNNHATKTIDGKTYTQLGISQDEFDEDGKKHTLENKSLENAVSRDDETPSSESSQTVPCYEEQSNQEESKEPFDEQQLIGMKTESTGHSIQASFTDLINTNAYLELLNGQVDDFSIYSDTGLEQQQQMMAEIENLSRDLMFTSEVVGKELNAPSYTPVTPILRQKKKKTITGEKESGHNRTRRRKKCQKKLLNQMDEKDIDLPRKVENSDENKVQEEKEHGKKMDKIESDSENTKSEEKEEHTTEERKTEDGNIEKHLASMTALSQFLDKTKIEKDENKGHDNQQQTTELKVDDVDNLLNMIDPTDDVLSNTFLVDPESRRSRKSIEKCKESTPEKTVPLCTDTCEIMEDLAAACLPDAYDLWKDKYRSLVEEEYPDAGSREVEHKLRDIWCKIPDEHRKRYYDKAEKLVRRYSTSAAFSYMNRFKCVGSRYPKRGLSMKDSPHLLQPKAVRAIKADIESCATEEEDDLDADNMGDESFSTSFDYTKVMKETTTFNSPNDKELKKTLGKLQEAQGDLGKESDFTDENALATSVLMDIMMGNGNEANRDEEQLSAMWAQTDVPDLTKTSCLDISGLDDYLCGKGGSPLIKEEKKKRKMRRRKKKEEGKSVGN